MGTSSGKQLIECQKKFAALQANCKDMRKGLGDADKTMGKQGRTFQNMIAGIKERVQELMDEGYVGKSLKDYVGDKEVRQMVVVAHDCMHNMTAGASGMTKGMKDKLGDVSKEYGALKKQVQEVIAEKTERAKSKKPSPDKAEDQQSLPKLEKLLKDLVAFERDKKEGLAGLNAVSTGETTEDTRDFQDGLKKMISGMKPDPSKAKKASGDFKKQGLDQSKIDAKVKQVARIERELDAAIRKAKAAHAARNTDELDLAQVAVGSRLEELEDIAAKYKDVPKDKQLAEQARKDSKIAKMLKDINGILVANKQAIDQAKSVGGLKIRV